jgi:hypothetical protein
MTAIMIAIVVAVAVVVVVGGLDVTGTHEAATDGARERRCDQNFDELHDPGGFTFRAASARMRASNGLATLRTNGTRDRIACAASSALDVAHDARGRAFELALRLLGHALRDAKLVAHANDHRASGHVSRGLFLASSRRETKTR